MTDSSRSLDLVIRNGLVVDGAGNPWFRADVGIQDGRIARVGRIDPAQAKASIYARGQVVVHLQLDHRERVIRRSDLNDQIGGDPAMPFGRPVLGEAIHAGERGIGDSDPIGVEREDLITTLGTVDQAEIVRPYKMGQEIERSRGDRIGFLTCGPLQELAPDEFRHRTVVDVQEVFGRVAGLRRGRHRAEPLLPRGVG